MRAPAENPLCFGHAEAETQFLNAFRSKRLPHSWIIVGPKGVGKRTFCYQLIRFLFAGHTHLSSEDPLFRRIAARSHGDLLVLEKDSGVEAIRAAKGFLQKTTAEGGWRVILLEGLETLNRFGANALLKSLEEPPPQTLFFLTSRTLSGILPTIRSRCRILTLRPLEDNLLKEALTQMGYGEKTEALNAVISLAQGCVGKAMNLFQEERWKKILTFRTCLLRACFSPTHLDYQAPFTSEMMALWTGESLSFWEEALVDWLHHLLKMEGTLEEKEVFVRSSPAVWWYRLDQINLQMKRSLHAHLDPLHTLSCVLRILTN